MHELSICIALIDQVQKIAAEHNAERVSKIVLCIGPLAGIEPDLLKNAYPIAAAGTVAYGAELKILRDDVTVRCDSCGTKTVAAPNRLLCGNCGDYRTQVTSGDAMVLRRLELDKADGHRSNQSTTATH